MRVGMHLTAHLERKRKGEAALHRDPEFSLFFVIAGGLYIMIRVLFWASVFDLADRGGAFPPPLLLQQLDAVVHVKLNSPPVSLVAHQQGAEF